MRSAASSATDCAGCSARPWWWKIAPAPAGRSARLRSQMRRLTATRSASALHRRWRSIPQPTRTFRSMCSISLRSAKSRKCRTSCRSIRRSKRPTWRPSSRLPARVQASCPMRRRATVRSATCSASSSSSQPAPTSCTSHIAASVRRSPRSSQGRLRSSMTICRLLCRWCWTGGCVLSPCRARRGLRPCPMCRPSARQGSRT